MTAKKPWLRKGLTLDQRIEAGTPTIMDIIRPDERHAEECRNEMIEQLRGIGKIDLHEATPRQMRKSVLATATKVKEAQTIFASVPWQWYRRPEIEEKFEGLIKDLEAMASRLVHTVKGPTVATELDSRRKGACTFHANFVLDTMGTRGRPTTSEKGRFVHLSEVMFEVASGHRGSLVKAVKSFVKRFGVDLQDPKRKTSGWALGQRETRVKVIYGPLGRVPKQTG
jgi:hypothetical protein